MIEELARHGYRLSPGTLYPLLHSMEAKGYLLSRVEGRGRGRRRLYRATPAGAAALATGRSKLRELFREVVGEGGA
jgi:DNA-binding PadR family transcriptional regulator